MPYPGETPLSVTFARCPECRVYTALPEGLHCDGDLIPCECEACGSPFMVSLLIRSFPENIGHLIEMAMQRGEWVAE